MAMPKPSLASPAYSIFREAQSLLATMIEESFVKNIDVIGRLLAQATRQKKTIFIAGNGGAFADADHFASELRAQFERKNRPALPALALPISLSTVTAWGNDYNDGFESAMQRDLEALAKPGDVLIAISTSGKAENVRRALNWAKTNRVVRVAISGNGPESQSFGKLADDHIVIPHHQTARIQEAYQVIIHILCSYIDQYETT
jgi:D-sedoheptulose 7-phosphate isomerase